jgi:surfeit locus 1 family protein
VVLAVALAGTLLAARLSLWQLDRAAQKEALQATLDSRTSLPRVSAAELAQAVDSPSAVAQLLYRKVLLNGRWLADQTVYLDNRQMNARPGFIVVTPLQWSGGTVLVQRGWLARDNNERTRLPLLVTPKGEVEVRGRIAPSPARLYEFSGAASGPIRQNLDIEGFSREMGLALLPVSVLQDEGAAADGLLRAWSRPALDTQKNYGYAFQWALLGALIVGLYVWYQIVRPRMARHPQHDDPKPPD